MSHFSVLVTLNENSEEELKAALQPFHEYECTGVKDQYVKFMEIESECLCDLKSAYKDYEDGEEFENFNHFMKEEGYSKKDGKFGYLTNPNKKWDWWFVGGRFSNRLILKSGGKADCAKKSDIDFDAMIKEALDYWMPIYDKAQEILGGEKYKTWEEILNSNEYKDHGERRKFYNGQNLLKELRENLSSHESLMFVDCDKFLIDRDSFVKQKEFEAVGFFAMLHKGNWIEKGSMGWWGCVSEENPDWREVYTKALESITDDMILVVVDCHI